MATGARDWFVLHVKPRTEKKVMQYLSRSRGFRHLPVYVKVTKVQRRKVRRELPLFPGPQISPLQESEQGNHDDTAYSQTSDSATAHAAAIVHVLALSSSI